MQQLFDTRHGLAGKILIVIAVSEILDAVEAAARHIHA
jgi:hypothetical protein